MKNLKVYFALLILVSIVVWVLVRTDSPLLSNVNSFGVDNAQTTTHRDPESDSPNSHDFGESDRKDMVTGTESSDVISEIPASLSRTSQTYFDPFEIVERHLNKAELGDPTSNFIIAEVGLFCRNAPASEASLDSIKSDPRMDKYMIRKAVESFKRCAQLKFEGNRALDENIFPLTSGRHDQFPLYQLRYDSIVREERLGLIIHAISTGLDEPFLTGYVLEAYASLFERYDGYEDEFTVNAAQFAACKFQKLCDPIEFAAAAQKYYPPSKYQELIAQAERIQEGIQDRDPKKLGL